MRVHTSVQLYYRWLVHARAAEDLEQFAARVN
jgi:hypothetical protein